MATLLGVRHGVDLVRVLHELAVMAEDGALKSWTEAWLLQRLELLEQAETELAWFVANPARALEPVRQTPLAFMARSALRGSVSVRAARLGVSQRGVPPRIP